MSSLRALGLAALALYSGCSAPPAADSGTSGSLYVVTQTPVRDTATTRQPHRLDPDARYPVGSRVVLVSSIGGSTDVRVLSGELHVAGAPAVSPDAESVLLAGRRTDDAPWAIYEVRARGSALRKVVETASDCIDPAYLSAGRIVFSCVAQGATSAGAATWSLYTAARDGSDLRRVTFGPDSAFDPAVLQDGRLLFSMRRAEDGTVGLFTVNPDGTLLDEFVGGHDTEHELRPRPTADRVVFLSTSLANGSRVEQVRLSYPSASRSELVLEGATVSARLADPLSVEPLPDGQFLLSARALRSPSWGIFRTEGQQRHVEPVLDTAEWHEVEAVPLARRATPRGRPSAVDPALRSGTLVCYDIHRTDGHVGPAEGAPRAVAVSIHSKDTVASGEQEIVLGRLPVERDGSFFVEVPADAPLRVVSLDERGAEIAASGWFWVRPGEVRACFGCHEARESAPVNRTIAALASEPVRIGLDGVPR